MTPQSHYATLAGLEIHYMDWGRAERGTVIAWHGLARTGRDMDDLAAHLAGQGWRVICPDTVGRGLSQWSPDPQAHYCLAFYVRLARELLDALALTQVQWVGTSMGGAIGLLAAAGRQEPSLASRIERLVLNDMAPEISPLAVERIRSYAGGRRRLPRWGSWKPFSVRSMPPTAG